MMDDMHFDEFPFLFTGPQSPPPVPRIMPRDATTDVQVVRLIRKRAGME